MNASDWHKATTLITQQKSAATTAQTDELSSILLSTLSLDDSGPPQVQYSSHVSLAASTPNKNVAHNQSPQQADYQEIIPDIHQGSIYPTLSALST